jgi:hypothetical protein
LVKSIINLSEQESRIVNVVKAKYGLKDKSQAISLILKRYEECELEPQLRPEFIKEIQQTQEHSKFLKVKVPRDSEKPK